MKLLFKKNLCLIFGMVIIFGSSLSPFVAISAERFCGVGETNPISYSISYDYREVNEYVFEGAVPFYEEPNPNNSCAVVAGTILVGYFDYFCPELMPNFDSWYIFNNKLYFKPLSNDAIVVRNELYNLMKTNVGGVGTTEANFLNGLNNYVQNKGYSPVSC